jgi:hypothetical protein
MSRQPLFASWTTPFPPVAEDQLTKDTFEMATHIKILLKVLDLHGQNFNYVHNHLVELMYIHTKQIVTFTIKNRNLDSAGK